MRVTLEDHRALEQLAQAVFDLGVVTVTDRAVAALRESGQFPPDELIARHARSDWGDLDPPAIALNEMNLRNGRRVRGAYRLKSGSVLWIITDAKRTKTEVMLAEEYGEVRNGITGGY